MDIALGQKLSVEFGKKSLKFLRLSKNSETGCFCEPHPTFGDFELKFLQIRNTKLKKSKLYFWLIVKVNHFVEISWNQKKKDTKLEKKLMVLKLANKLPELSTSSKK